MTQETGVHKASLEVCKVLLASIAHLQPTGQAPNTMDHYRRGHVGILLCIGDAREVAEEFEPYQGTNLAGMFEGLKGAIQASCHNECLHWMFNADVSQLDPVPFDDCDSPTWSTLRRCTSTSAHCGEGWGNGWSCGCDDECAVCGHDIESFRRTLFSGSGEEHSHGE